MLPVRAPLLLLLLPLPTAVLLAVPAAALDNGLALTPPRGFRTWNQFGIEVNQSMMSDIIRAMAQRRPPARGDGAPLSLVDLGYTHAGVDDGWQLCGSGAAGGFHNASGYPNIDPAKFPDPRSMTQLATSLGISAGWYANNCHCADHSATCKAERGAECTKGDVAAVVDLGFRSLKVDGCGTEGNVSLFAELLNRSGVPVLLENCHRGTPTRGADGSVRCDMNLFRTSKDIRPTFGSIVSNLLTVDKFNAAGLTGPGCWAYPDMLEVGVSAPQPPGAKHHCQKANVPCEMNSTEWITHFSAWAITSSPLVLGMDLRDEAALQRAWPIISNKHALDINAAWAGDSGRLLTQSEESTHVPNCGSGSGCELPLFLVWSKALAASMAAAGGRSAAAVLLMNNGDAALNVSSSLGGVRGLGACDAGKCTSRDVWSETLSEEPVVGGAVARLLGPHASALFVVSSSEPAPPPTPPPPAPTPPGPAPPAPPGPAPPPSTACRWIPGAGLKGNDIAHARSPTKEACCGACKAHSQCKAACWRPLNHTGSLGGCHMKKGLNTDPGGKADADAVVCVPT